MTGPSATPDRYPYQNEPIWSRSEKAIARKAFDAALKRELHEVIQETKQMASQIKEPSDLWELERYLTERRKDIDRKYDTRGSRLKDVLGRLLLGLRGFICPLQPAPTSLTDQEMGRWSRERRLHPRVKCWNVPCVRRMLVCCRCPV